MAITAWSAKVFSSFTCFSEKGRLSRRATLIVPIGTASRNIGTASIVR